MYSIQAHAIASYSELETFRSQFEEIWTKSATRWPNTTWEWLAAWWKHLRGDQKLLLLEIKDGGSTVGFAPFALAESGPLSSRRLTVPGPGLMDYADFLSIEGREGAVIETIAAYLASADSWDTLAIEQLRWNPTSVKAFCAPFLTHGQQARAATGKQTWIANLDTPWDEWILKFGSRWREHTRRIIRRVEKAEPTYFLAESEADCLKLLRSLFAMRDMKDTDDPATIDVSQNPYFQFHAEVVPALLKKGIIYLYGLSIKGDLSAVVYGLRYADTFLYYLPGYDRRVSNLSPGTALTAYIIQDAIRRGIAHFDFGRGDEEYKQHWLATPQPTTEITITASRLSSQFRIFSERAVRKVKRTIR